MSNNSNDQDRVAQTHDPERPSESGRGEETAAAKFQRELASRTTDRDDYEPEEQLWSGGYSPKAMVGVWILMAIASVGLLMLAFLVPPLTLPLALGLILLIWLIGGLRYAWRRLGVHYQLTSQRFIHQTGILTRHTDRIEVIDIDDVSYTQGPVQRIFGVGKIVLTGSDRTHPTLTMFGIADVKEVAGLIDDVRRAERRRRSLHIEAI